MNLFYSTNADGDSCLRIYREVDGSIHVEYIDGATYTSVDDIVWW